VAPSWVVDRCADCRREIEPTGNKRRRVPRLGGKVRIVCTACADAIDAQAVLGDGALGKRAS
jgi:hypothetical protein